MTAARKLVEHDRETEKSFGWWVGVQEILERTPFACADGVEYVTFRGQRGYVFGGMLYQGLFVPHWVNDDPICVDPYSSKWPDLCSVLAFEDRYERDAPVPSQVIVRFYAEPCGLSPIKGSEHRVLWDCEWVEGDEEQDEPLA